MTKNSTIFAGTQNGKLAASVYYRTKGQQIVKRYNGAPANPKTNAQLTTRVTLANVTNFYNLIKNTIPVFFQNKKKGSTDVNAFTAANKEKEPIYLTKQEAASGLCILRNYQVCSGSLMQVPPAFIRFNESRNSWELGINIPVNNYTGNNMQSVRNAFINYFNDFSGKETFYLLHCYTRNLVNHAVAYIIDFKDNFKEDAINYFENGDLVVLMPESVIQRSGACAVRAYKDKYNHPLISSQSVVLSALSKNIAIVYSQALQLDTAIMSYK